MLEISSSADADTPHAHPSTASRPASASSKQEVEGGLHLPVGQRIASPSLPSSPAAFANSVAPLFIFASLGVRPTDDRPIPNQVLCLPSYPRPTVLLQSLVSKSESIDRVTGQLSRAPSPSPLSPSQAILAAPPPIAEQLRKGFCFLRRAAWGLSVRWIDDRHANAGLAGARR